MAKRGDISGLSELEREFELEMEDESDSEFESSLGADEELDEFEAEEDELEADDVMSGPAYESDDPAAQEYVERLMELSAREFESESEVDQALNEVLDGMAREYFFGRLRKGIKSLAKNRVLRGLAKKGLKLGIRKFFPGVQAALQLAKGNVKGALLNFGKQALGSVVPGGTATLDALKSLGMVAGVGGPNRETWENYVGLSREAFEYLADNVTENADQPTEAVRLASNAIQHAVRQTQNAVATGGGMAAARGGRMRTVRLRLRPGERLKLIIVGQ